MKTAKVVDGYVYFLAVPCRCCHSFVQIDKNQMWVHEGKLEQSTLIDDLKKRIAELENTLRYLAGDHEYCPEVLTNEVGGCLIPWEGKPECANCVNQENKTRCLIEWWSELASKEGEE